MRSDKLPRFPLRRARRVVVVFALLAGALAAQSSQAIGHARVSGTVTDPYGTPVSGATVWEPGGQVVFTDSNGYYLFEHLFRLGRTNWNLQFAKGGFEQQERTVHLVDGTHQELNMQMPITMYSWTLWPEAVSVVGGTLQFDADTRLFPNSACVNATDISSGTVIPLIGERQPSGWIHWKATWSLPSDTAPGEHFVDFVAVDCQSGLELSRVDRRNYYLDLEAPTFSVLTPVTGHTYIDDQDMGPSEDGRTHLSAAGFTFSVQASDDAGLYQAFFVLDPQTSSLEDRGSEYEWSSCGDGCWEQTDEGWTLFHLPKNHRFSARYNFTYLFGGRQVRGEHVVRVIVYDFAGRSAFTDIPFVVDG